MYLGQVRIRGKVTREEFKKEFAKWQKGEKSSCEVVHWTEPSGKPLRLGLRGMGVIKEYARVDSLYCDFDTKNPPTFSRLHELLSWIGIPVDWIRYDKTQNGWHVIVRTKTKFEPLETVALQAMLGSDMKRERFNLVRAMSGKAGNPRWNMLFEYKI